MVAAAIYAGQPDPLVVLVLSVVLFAAALLAQRVPALRGSGPILGPSVDLVMGAVAGFALAAPLALPGYQIAGHAIRIIEGSAFYRQSAWPFQSIGYLAFWGLNGVDAERSPIYLGVIVVVLAVTGACLRRRGAEVLALVTVAVVMGAVAFLQPVEDLLHSLPGVQAVRWYRAVVPMTLAVAVLSAVGMQLLVSAFRERLVRRWLGGGFLLAAGCLLVIWVVGSGMLTGTEVSTRRTGLVWAAAEVVVGLAGIAVLTVVTRSPRSGDRHPVVVGRAVGVVFLASRDGLLAHSRRSPASLDLHLRRRRPLARSPCRRPLGHPWWAWAPPIASGRRDSASGPMSIFSTAWTSWLSTTRCCRRNYYQSWADVTGKPPRSAGLPSVSHYCPAITSASLARVYGVGFVLERHGQPGPKGGVFVKSIEHEDLYRIPGASAATLTPSPPGGGFPAVTAGGTGIPVAHPGPASWKLETDVMTRETLRLRLTDVPGWHGTIDGKPLELKPYAGIMIQAQVPPGRHVIELRYWPTTFSAGIVLAIIAAVSLLAALIVESRRPGLRPGR